MNILEIADVSKRYGEYLALKHINIQIKEACVFGLLGPNGAGKTSLIRIINQITAPDEGQLFFKGEPMTIRHTAQIGYLPEERGLYRKMKVGEQALYLSLLKGLDKTEALRRLHYWFEKFEIEAWWNKKVEELSKGMQQKIQFIVTIVHEPAFLIFDEPFSGFDPLNANLLKEEMINLKNKGASIIFSTHNMASVEALCDDIALINKSEKILDGSLKDIRQAYKRNVFEIKYISDNVENIAAVLPPGAEVVKARREDNLNTVSVQLPHQFTGNQLLVQLLPHLQICEFKEVYPTMEEIFIQSVSNNQ
ncbi:MAG: ATP-binding cassette domain-containing protein [Bacteroidales bacterium]|nr:ATP-binding cassette domain-containing protein [Bacteroidales bacterium]